MIREQLSCRLRTPPVGFPPVRQRAQHGVRTWHFCLAALALLAFAAMVAVSRIAVAAPVPSAPGALIAGMEASTPRAIEPAPMTANAALLRSLRPLDVPGVANPSPAVAPRLSSPAALVGRLGASGQGRQLRAQVTAYSASEEEGTAWGITRSGTTARPGVVAVDPSVILLGSRVRIAGLPGIYRAEDTGGGIHGAHIDVFMKSRADAFRFGRQTSVLVEVLD